MKEMIEYSRGGQKELMQQTGKKLQIFTEKQNY